MKEVDAPVYLHIMKSMQVGLFQPMAKWHDFGLSAFKLTLQQLHIEHLPSSGYECEFM